MKKTDTGWYKFEQAVAALLAALDETATVTHDVSLPDKDTGTPRQRDVWIESSVSGIRIKIYVSCKYYERKLNQQDMDAFIGELRSSGAHKGVLYSKLGFNADAIKKASVNEIDCCVLVDSDNFTELIPKELIIRQFARRGRINLTVENSRKRIDISEFLHVKSRRQNKRIVIILAQSLKELVRKSKASDVDDITTSLEIDPETQKESFRLTIRHQWIYYEAHLTGYLVNGSYTFGENSFKGAMTFPAIDTRNVELGPEWAQLASRPFAINMILITLEPDYLVFWKNFASQPKLETGQ